MPNFICQTCGTQFADSNTPPAACPICQDERQYIGWRGQEWTTMEALSADHQVVFKTEEPNLTGIGIEPGFAIAQRALLVQSPHGNVLWDCIPLIDERSIQKVTDLGGLSAIAISHPHFYSGMVEWSKAFNAPIYLHADDRRWVMRPDPGILFWEGETLELADGLTLIRCGGHFEGGQVLHWAAGADGAGVLLTGDTLYVVSDRRYVSFMRSYPNLIPLPARAVQKIAATLEPYAYDRIYSAWFERVVLTDARNTVARSVKRYVQAIKDG